MANVRMPSLKLTLVDGFSAGGLYSHCDGVAYGSPLLMMQAVQEAQAQLNSKLQRIERRVDAQYHFVELKKQNFAYLQHLLKIEGHGDRIGRDIALYNADFDNVCSSIIASIKQRKAGERALFLLDQYNYDSIKLPTVHRIMSTLKGAEVILTFNVDSLLAYLSDSENFHSVTRKIGLEQYINWSGYAAQKAQKRWRQIIQSQIAYGIWKASGARFLTLFFVRPRGDTPWSYWLVHLSNVYKANDVMKGVHWEHGNSFGHSLGPGLFQIGYETNQDAAVTGQMAIDFGATAAFDRSLHEASVLTLQEQLPKIVYANESGLPFIELLQGIANQTNATADITKEALTQHILTGDIRAMTKEGGSRVKASAIHPTDILIPSKQKTIFM